MLLLLLRHQGRHAELDFSMAAARNFLDDGSSDNEQSLESACSCSCSCSSSASRIRFAAPLSWPLVELTCCCCKCERDVLQAEPLVSWLPPLRFKEPLLLKEVSALVGGGVEKTPAKLCCLASSSSACAALAGEAARDSSPWLWLEMEEMGLRGGLLVVFLVATAVAAPPAPGACSCVWAGAVGLLNALSLKLWA